MAEPDSGTEVRVCAGRLVRAWRQSTWPFQRWHTEVSSTRRGQVIRRRALSCAGSLSLDQIRGGIATVAGDFQVAATPDAHVPYVLLGPAGEPVKPVQDYLADLLASDCTRRMSGSPLSTRAANSRMTAASSDTSTSRPRLVTWPRSSNSSTRL